MENSDIHLGLDRGGFIDKRYEVIELLSTSENEVLLRAIDKALDNEQILIKVYHVSFDSSASDLKRFRNEVIVARRLAHPNINRVFDLGRFGKHYYYITLEDRQGVALSDVIKDNPKGLPFNLAINIIYQIANALTEAHAQNIIHRCLSPENIFVSKDKEGYHASLVNFGYGKILGIDNNLTRTGELIGNPAYMAPEQIRGESLDPRADIYALGVITYELITGQNPFGNSKLSFIQSIQKEATVPEISFEGKDKIQAWLNELIQAASKKEREDRLASMQEFRDQILIGLKISSFSRYKVSKRAGQNRFRGIREYTKLILLSVSSVFIFASLFLFKAEIKDLVNSITSQNNVSSVLEQNVLAATVSGDDALVYQGLKGGVSAHLTDKSGVTLAILAANYGRTNVLYTLIQHDRSILEVKNNDQQTLLIIAVQKENLSLVKMLVKFKLDPTYKDNFGKSALDYAKEKQNEEILLALSN